MVLYVFREVIVYTYTADYNTVLLIRLCTILCLLKKCS